MPNHPHTLSALSTREAIADVVYRGVLAFDRNDVALLESAVAGEDVRFEIHDGGPEVHAADSLTQLRESVFAHVGPMDTTHTVSNMRIDVQDEAQKASLTAYAVAQHCPPGRGREPDGPKFMAGGEYAIDLEKDGASGEWKIRKWVLHLVWRQGDASIMVPGPKPEK